MNWHSRRRLFAASRRAALARIAQVLPAVSDVTSMNAFRWSPLPRRPRAYRPTAPSSLRIEVCPPSLRQAPASSWRRLWFWLSAPAPQDAAPPLSRLPAVREDFVRCLGDVALPQCGELHRRIGLARSLRELWHLRAELYRVVAIAHSQSEAERRLAALNRHFPTRAPRTGFAALAS
jgi:hypothetical protein